MIAPGLHQGGEAAAEMPGRPHRLAALVLKESRQVLRDPSSILIAFVLPLVLLFLFGFGVSLDASRIRLGIVVESPGPAVRDLAESFRGSRHFDAAMGHDRRVFEEALALGRLRGIVVLPAALDEGRAGRGQPEIQVIVDGSDPNTASFVQNYVRGAVAAWAAQRAAYTDARPPALTVEPRFWFNEELASRNFLVPGSVAIVMTLIGTLLTALVIAREWERGTMEAMMATPVGRAELLAGKIMPYFVLGMAAMLVCTLLAVVLFGVPLRGSLGALCLVSAVFLVPALGQGYLISAATKNQFVASQLALFTGFLPAMLLSGFVFEIGSMPAVIRAITTVVPARYLVAALQTLFLAGDVWSVLWPAMGMMLAIGTVFFLLAARATVRRLG